MRIANPATDEAILQELGHRLARTRLDLGLTQAQLAERAGVSKRTVERSEAGSVATQLSVFIRLCRALDLLERFELLVPEMVPSPIEQLRRKSRPRQRASSTKRQTARKTWQWGDDR